MHAKTPLLFRTNKLRLVCGWSRDIIFLVVFLPLIYRLYIIEYLMSGVFYNNFD